MNKEIHIDVFRRVERRDVGAELEQDKIYEMPASFVNSLPVIRHIGSRTQAATCPVLYVELCSMQGQQFIEVRGNRSHQAVRGFDYADCTNPRNHRAPIYLHSVAPVLEDFSII